MRKFFLAIGALFLGIWVLSGIWNTAYPTYEFKVQQILYHKYGCLNAQGTMSDKSGQVLFLSCDGKLYMIYEDPHGNPIVNPLGRTSRRDKW